jgi:CHAT domain-containing protein
VRAELAACERLASSEDTILEVHQREAEFGKAWQPLAAALAPVLKEIEPVRHWVLSPDSDLWLLPWEALPLAGGKYAVERHDVTYVVSGRDLLRPRPAVAGRAPLVLANPNYGSPRKPAAPSGLKSGSSVLSQIAFPPLSSTEREAQTIAPKLQSFLKQPAVVRLRDEASKKALLAHPSPRALVLSTHGFFLADPAVRNPLLRCGLALAGANQRAEGDTGILTGAEIVGLDLRGTELVVLSACETGLGEVEKRDGQGSASLRQAFHLAGARSVVASLWKVPTDETQFLMIHFFDHLVAGRGMSEALHEAQRDLIKHGRANLPSTHPFFWAAFTISGDPGRAGD